MWNVQIQLRVDVSQAQQLYGFKGPEYNIGYCQDRNSVRSKIIISGSNLMNLNILNRHTFLSRSCSQINILRDSSGKTKAQHKADGYLYLLSRGGRRNIFCRLVFKSSYICFLKKHELIWRLYSLFRLVDAVKCPPPKRN